MTSTPNSCSSVFGIFRNSGYLRARQTLLRAMQQFRSGDSPSATTFLPNRETFFPCPTSCRTPSKLIRQRQYPCLRRLQQISQSTPSMNMTSSYPSLSLYAFTLVNDPAVMHPPIWQYLSFLSKPKSSEKLRSVMQQVKMPTLGRLTYDLQHSISPGRQTES